MRRILLALLLALGASGAQAAEPAGEGAILLEAGPLPTDAKGKAAIDFMPMISAFDADQGAPKGSYQGKWIGLITADGAPPTALWGAKVKPGTYVLNAFSAQSFWNACYDQGAATFDVAPGQVVYLGQLDPRPVMADLARRLPRMSQNMQRFYLSTTGPALTPPEQIPDWQARIGPNLAKAFPAFAAPEPAAIRTSPFKRRRSILAELTC